MRKIFRRIVSALFIIGFLLVNAVSHAEIYTGEGSYVMSEEKISAFLKKAQKPTQCAMLAKKLALTLKVICGHGIWSLKKTLSRR